MWISRHLWAMVLSGLCLLNSGCEGAAGPTGQSPTVPRSPGLIKVETGDRSFSVDVPADLEVHPMTQAVMGAALDGTFRIYVTEIKVDTLLRLAGSGKETLQALGWRVDSEQHLEKAVQVTLSRGGTNKKPQEHRGVWWFLKDDTAYHCDGISTPEARSRLGEELRILCQGVSKRVPAQPREPVDPLSAP